MERLAKQNPYQNYQPKESRDSNSNASYKSQEYVMGLKVKVRNNGRDSFKQQMLKDINHEREKEISEIGLEDSKKLPPPKHTYLQKPAKFTSEKNFSTIKAPKLVRNSFEDEYQERVTVNGSHLMDKYSVPNLQRTIKSSENHIFIKDEEGPGQDVRPEYQF